MEIFGVDVNAGMMQNGGSLASYIQSLKKYCTNAVMLLEKLKEENTINNFALCAIYSRTLAKISRSIGALDLALIASDLEAAAKQGNLEAIKENSPNLSRKLEKLLIEIKNALSAVLETAAKKRILIIDDTEAFLLILSNVLKDDYEIMVAKNGTDGLKVANLTKPDLVLTDIIMPDISGIDVRDAMRKNPETKDIPVILISGAEAAEFEETTGLTSYIRKPFKTSEVRQKVEAILNLSSPK